MSELCFNLWYYLNKQQCITAIAARAYLLDGDEERMGAALMALSRHEYRTLQASPPPQGAALHYSELKRLGVEAVFKQEFERIRRALPSGIAFPEEKFFLATPLFDFGEGFVPAEIGNGFITERRGSAH